MTAKSTEELSRINELSAPEKQVTDLTGELDCSTVQNWTDRAFLERSLDGISLKQDGISAAYIQLCERA